MNQQHIDELGGLVYQRPGYTSDTRAPRPIVAEDVRDVEAKLGHAMPEDYAAFLLRYNEGAVSFGKNAAFRVPGDPGDLIGVDTFHSLLMEDKAPGYDLWTNYRMEQGLIPSWLLPVIGDAGGSYACVAISGLRRGQVFYWEHELIDYENVETSMQNVLFVAESFDQFMDMFEIFDDTA
jgi:hypothetical protein